MAVVVERHRISIEASNGTIPSARAAGSTPVRAWRRRCSLGLSDATPTPSSTTLAIATRSDKLAHAQHAFQPSYENLLIPPQLRSLPADCEISMPPAMWFGSDGNVLANYADDLVQWFRSKPWRRRSRTGRGRRPPRSRSGPRVCRRRVWRRQRPPCPTGTRRCSTRRCRSRRQRRALHRARPTTGSPRWSRTRRRVPPLLLVRRTGAPAAAALLRRSRDGTPGVSTFGVLPWVPVQGPRHLVTLGLAPPVR